MEREIDRLDKYLQHKGITDYSFRITTGISNAWIGSARKSGGSITDKVRLKILQAYQDLNKIWLITGEGEMFNGETPLWKGVPVKEEFSLVRFLQEKIAHQEEIIKLKDQIIEALKKEKNDK